MLKLSTVLRRNESGRSSRGYRPARGIAVALAVTLVAAGCADVARSGSGGGAVDRNATITVGVSVPPSQNDPIAANSELAVLPYYSLMFDTLIGLDAKGGPTPLIAEKWALAADQRSLTLTIRKNAVFHDGTPIDAPAVVANLQRAIAADTPLIRSKTATMESASADGDSTVVIRYIKPEPLAVVQLVSPLLGLISPASFATAATTPIGSGPYRFARQNQDSVTFDRFDRYWNPDTAKAAHFVIKGIPDNTARLNALEAGQLDLTNAQPDLTSALSRLSGTGAVTVDWIRTQANSVVFLNISRGPLADPRVRRALNYVVNRQAQSDALMGGQCKPNPQPFPTGPGYLPELDSRYTYDPAKARQLLAEAGFPALRLNGLFSNNALARVQAPAVQGDFQAAGIGFEMAPVPAQEARATFRQGKADFLVLQMNAEVDPALTIVNNFLGGDSPGGVPAEVRAAAEKVLALPVDAPERTAALQEFGRVATDTPTHVIICSPPSGFAYRNTITGVKDMPWLTVAQNTDFRTLAKTAR
ncbi:ABC transporter substrate-binding protein [Nocardia sp. NPDC052278]|uniref:ABC transporter substrate-binding protein n=1 Tax=unclassified Nocardia TaxID=2637762 RepID=UPI00369823FB